MVWLPYKSLNAGHGYLHSCLCKSTQLILRFGKIMVFPQTLTISALSLEMNVTNTATNTTVSCITSCGGFFAANLTIPPAYLSGPHNEDPSWCQCLTQLKAKGYNNEYYTYTNMLLDPVRRVLAIDQTWYCDDEDVKKPWVATVSFWKLWLITWASTESNSLHQAK